MDTATMTLLAVAILVGGFAIALAVEQFLQAKKKKSHS